MTRDDAAPQAGDGPAAPDTGNLASRLRAFQTPLPRASAAQFAVSLGGYLASCAAMYAAFAWSYWLTLALLPLAAGFLVRLFIIQHDCGHRAYFETRPWNDRLGRLCSLFTLTPYDSWRRQHAGHHGVWNNLDRRDRGADIYSSCLTVSEYRALGPWRRRAYRLSRTPLVANLLLPPLIFLLLYRLPFDMPAGWGRERRAVYLTDAALLAGYGGLGAALGFGAVAAVQLPVIALAGIVGVWLFTVQHRSDDVVWMRETDWTPGAASLQGATHLRLPAVLQWFTGNIGLHHIHHLNPRIPNYRLPPCLDATPELRAVPVLTLGHALRAVFLLLWDEETGRMVTIRGARIRGDGGPAPA